MIPHEKQMVERLKNKPFALLGINSDQDRDVLKSLSKEDKELCGKSALFSPAELAALTDEKRSMLAKVREGNLANLNKILKENGISWRQAAECSTRGPIPTRWNVQGWPTIYVLDESGTIRFKGPRDQELEDAAIKLLDELAAKNAKH